MVSTPLLNRFRNSSHPEITRLFEGILTGFRDDLSYLSIALLVVMHSRVSMLLYLLHL